MDRTPSTADVSGSAARRGLELLFTPFSLGAMTLPNRVAMAPMTRRKAAEDGIVTRESVEYYRRRAAGGVGLVISEGTPVDEVHAFDTVTVPRIVTRQQLEAWSTVVEAVQAEGAAFAPQLWHTGRMAADPLGPSAEPPRTGRGDRTYPAVRAMGEAELNQVIGAFRAAAAAARDIGCDAVEIHGAHGYLLDSFLDARFNRRDDAWGGDATRRMAFPLAVARAVREAVGPDVPVIYRFSQWQVEDYQALKWRSPDELAPWVRALANVGVDLLHVSTRRATDPAFPEHGPRTLAGWARELSGLPAIAVGGITLHRQGEGPSAPLRVADPAPDLELLARGEADLLAVGRMLIANPEWPARVREGRWQELGAYEPAMLDELR